MLVFLVLTFGYYAMTSKVTAKASVLFTTTCAFGMLVSLLQSIGIIGMMTVDWPVDLNSFLSYFQVLLLDLDSFGFVPWTSNVPPGQIDVVAVVCPRPALQGPRRTFATAPVCSSSLQPSHGWLATMLLGCHSFSCSPLTRVKRPAQAVSQLVPKRRWDYTKTASCIGQVLQAGLESTSASRTVSKAAPETKAFFCWAKWKRASCRFKVLSANTRKKRRQRVLQSKREGEKTKVET